MKSLNNYITESKEVTVALPKAQWDAMVKVWMDGDLNAYVKGVDSKVADTFETAMENLYRALRNSED